MLRYLRVIIHVSVAHSQGSNENEKRPRGVTRDHSCTVRIALDRITSKISSVYVSMNRGLSVS